MAWSRLCSNCDVGTLVYFCVPMCCPAHIHGPLGDRWQILEVTFTWNSFRKILPSQYLYQHWGWSVPESLLRPQWIFEVHFHEMGTPFYMIIQAREQPGFYIHFNFPTPCQGIEWQSRKCQPIHYAAIQEYSSPFLLYPEMSSLDLRLILELLLGLGHIDILISNFQIQLLLSPFQLTVLPALSNPRIKIQYSSFWKMYFQSPEKSENILNISL